MYCLAFCQVIYYNKMMMMMGFAWYK